MMRKSLPGQALLHARRQLAQGGSGTEYIARARYTVKRKVTLELVLRMWFRSPQCSVFTGTSPQPRRCGTPLHQFLQPVNEWV
ncbi:hypothetical protein PISMIDRAFT_672591 [Pisolithus microcarpus 441]|uniref:Uncharacterized protein n=1 Tax=Pisolithus microcarpus 441 TaxID=765257 RepID=A0A0C9ZIU1_9AGAM|nr:hypothetical protein PISMIDRAFT_672591 [Pisolithus microcarpus 441]